MPLPSDKVPARRAYQRRYRKGNLDYQSRYMSRKIRREHGDDAAEAFLEAVTHSHVCAICGEGPGIGRSLCLDHNHRTGAFRGILCGRCNLLLGKVGDSPALLRKALRYLEGKGFAGLP